MSNRKEILIKYKISGYMRSLPGNRLPRCNCYFGKLVRRRKKRFYHGIMECKYRSRKFSRWLYCRYVQIIIVFRWLLFWQIYNQAWNWICNQQWNYTPGAFVDDDWGLSFVIPGIMIMALAIILWLFLVPSPDGMWSHLEYRKLQHSDNNWPRHLTKRIFFFSIS